MTAGKKKIKRTKTLPTEESRNNENKKVFQIINSPFIPKTANVLYHRICRKLTQNSQRENYSSQKGKL